MKAVNFNKYFLQVIIKDLLMLQMILSFGADQNLVSKDIVYKNIPKRYAVLQGCL